MLKRLILWMIVLAPMLAVGQTPQLAYDVVTIKPNDSGTDNSSTSMGESTFKASNVAIKRLLFRAYGIRQDLIFGLPDWAESARFDVNAKVVDPDEAALKKLTPDQRRLFILAILKDRFHLQAHIAMKQLPVYELLLAGDTSKLHAVAGPVEGPGSMGTDSDGTHKKLTATGVEMSSVAGLLTNQADRTVLDRTGLKGRYDVEVKWTDDRGVSMGDNGANGSGEEEKPGLFTALKEQLGLKLVPGRGPVPTLVVDHVERPSEN